MMVNATGVIVLGALALAVGAEPTESEPTGEPELYRSDNYRAPTPPALRGARVISTLEAQAIWKAGSAAFVDVLPHVPRPPNLPAGTLWREQQRLNIPG